MVDKDQGLNFVVPKHDWTFSDIYKAEALNQVVPSLELAGKKPKTLLIKGDSMITSGEMILVISFEDYQALLDLNKKKWGVAKR